MNYPIKVTRTTHSRLSEVNFQDIPFGKTFSDHLFQADYIQGHWQNFRLEPFHNLSLHPASMALHYGQAIFEGMKASRTIDGHAVLFRPDMHAHRMNASATRMCMPVIPEELFIEAIKMLVSVDRDWIPADEGSAFYLRPLMIATDEFVGVKPSQTYKFLVFGGPVGPYYPKPVSLLAQTEYIRAAKGGVGEAKAAGNYGAAMLPSRMAQEKGFDQVLWLDGRDFKYIQEVGTMNIFFVIGDKVVTPATDGAILKGITRLSAIELLRENGYQVEERPVSIDELVEAHQNGSLKEAFGAGTAAVIAQVSRIAYKDIIMELPPLEERKIGDWIKAQINGIRSGRIADTHGWIVSAEVPAPVA